MSLYKLIGPFQQVVTMANLFEKGPLLDAQLEIIEQGGVLIKGEKIHSVGKYSDLLGVAEYYGATYDRLSGDHICLPGLIDAHTHICFAGTRSKDFAMRNAGKSYLEIASDGGGIWDTVSQTRQASHAELLDGILKRINRLTQSGITTVEVKSGYGLSFTEELKMLEVIKNANAVTRQDLIATCLAAHIFPKDYQGNSTAYLQEISEELFPMIKERQLGNRIDAFIERGAFSSEVITPYLLKAKESGFDICLHADQFTVGGSELAVKIGAKSADHLEASGAKEIELLSKSKVMPIALPGASIGLGCNFTPARKLLDAGCGLVIASDWNPGSAPMGDLMVQASILATFEKLSNAEVFAAITSRAAHALGLSDRGVLAPGFIADLSVYKTNDFNEILYQQGMLKPSMVWKKGDQIFTDKIG